MVDCFKLLTGFVASLFELTKRLEAEIVVLRRQLDRIIRPLQCGFPAPALVTS
jgi:hypothetical protein